MRTRLPHILMGGALTSVLVSTLPTSANALSLPVVTARDIAGAAPTEQVYWYGRLPNQFRGGRGWRDGVAAGLIAGGLIGAAAAAPHMVMGIQPTATATQRITCRPTTPIPPTAIGPPHITREASTTVRSYGYRRTYWRPAYSHDVRRAYWRTANGYG